MQIGIRNVVSITNSIEMPSTPILYFRPPSHAPSSTNWKPADPLSKCIQIGIETTKVRIVVHSAIQRAFPLASRLRHATSSRADQRQERDERKNVNN